MFSSLRSIRSLLFSSNLLISSIFVIFVIFGNLSNFTHFVQFWPFWEFLLILFSFVNSKWNAMLTVSGTRIWTASSMHSPATKHLWNHLSVYGYPGRSRFWIRFRPGVLLARPSSDLDWSFLLIYRFLSSIPFPLLAFLWS